MAEKPILKKDRTPNDQVQSERDPKPPSQNRGPSKDKGKDNGKDNRKGKGKGKGKGDREAKVAPLNPALMRGPRPAKKVEPEPEVEIPVEAITEETPTASSDSPDLDPTPDQSLETPTVS